MDKTAFCRFSRAVCAFVCVCGILCHHGKYALLSVYLRHAARWPEYSVGMFPILAGARARCPAVWLHGGLLVCLLQNIRAILEHAPRRLALFIRFARFHLSICLSVCLFSLFRLFLTFSFPSFPCFPRFPTFPTFPFLFFLRFHISYI